MRIGFLRSLWVVAALAFCLLPGVARAQVSTGGQIAGTVFDPSGKTIPGAEITVTSPTTNFTQTVKASGTGGYVFSALSSGTYTVSVSATGFATIVFDNVVVQVAQTTDLPVHMSVGSMSQTVTVTAAPVLQSTQNTLATTISPALMEDLPLNGRDVLEFATLAPGAANTGIHGNNYNTYNDMPNAAVNISISGTTDQFQRYKTFSSSFWDVAPAREGAFEEATVSTAGLDSANGMAGSQVQFAVKRGTDQYHGRAFWQAENSFFNANAWSNNAQGIPNPKYRNNWYGGNLGGPLLPKSWMGNHNAYFFVNLEYYKAPYSFSTYNYAPTGTTSGPTTDNCAGSGEGAVNGCYTYEVSSIPTTTPAWVSSCSSSAMTCTANLYTLASAYGLPTTENSSVSNIIGGIAGYYKNGSLVPLGPTQSALQADNAYFLQRLNYTINQPTTVWYPTTRLDVDITSKIHWMDSWDLEDSKTPSYGDWPGSPYVGNYTGFNNTYYSWNNSVTWTISPTMINTATFGILGVEEVYTPGAQPTGFSQTQVGGVPSQIEMPFGTCPNGSACIPDLVPDVAEETPRDNPVYNPYDTLRWTHGNHNFYFGGAIYYSKMREQEWDFPGVPDYTTGIAAADPASAMFGLPNFPDINNSESVTTGLTSQTAAEDLYAFLVGRVSSVGGGTEVNPATGQFQPGYGYTAMEAKTEGSLYFQDSWRATPHFTLNYGLRWQLTGAIHNTNDEYFSATPQNLLGPSAGEFQPGTLNGIQSPYLTVNEHPYNGDFIQPAPNLGFAWNPDYSEGFLGKLFGGSKTVIRGSYTINQYDEGWETFENNTVYNGAGYTQYLNYSAAAGDFTPGSVSLDTPGLLGAVQATATPPSYQTALPESTYSFFGYPTIAGINPNLKQPYLQQWTFGIQRQIPGNSVVEVDYVGNHVVHEWQNYNIDETNTLNNGFASEFKTAQGNLAANNNTTFADNTGAPGVMATPIFDAAFDGNGITTGANDPGGYANSNYITLLQQGQAGLMATEFAKTYQTACNLYGTGFSPCGSTGGTNPINFLQANPYASASGAEYLSDPGSSTYDGLQISVRHPTGHGLTLGGNYSWSKGLTSRFLSQWTDTAGEDFISLRDPGINKGPSDYDIRNVFHTYFTYALPVGRGRSFNVNNPFLNGVVGGWNVGSIISWQSGIPFWIQGGYDTFNNEDGGVIVSASASQIQKNIGVYSTPASPYAPEWINPNFNVTNVIQPNTNPGTIGQMLFLHGPGFFNTDISLNKVFPIYEKVSFKIQAAFLNAFNHPNWIVGSFGAPGYIDYASSSLYQPSTSYQGSPRIVQFRSEIDF
ncbi:MAG: carboxypeptidase-like regulatory domain-containing protein [Candidatus Acidiferrales bacterium]